MQREVLLRLARANEQETHVARGERRELRLLDDPAEHPLVEIVAAEHRVAARRHHFEYAARELQYRKIERAAAQVVDREDSLGSVVQAIGDRRRGGLVQQAKDIEARDPAGILRRLALRIVEIG